MIDKRIREEINDKWLEEMIRKLYYMETKEKLSSEEVSMIIMELYFDLAKVNDDKEIEFVKNKIKEYIDIYEEKIENRKNIAKNYKERLIALVGAIILFISIPTGLFIKGKRDSRQTLYKTKTQECSFNIIPTYDGYEYKANTYTYHSEYKPLNEADDMVKIIDEDRWQVEGKEAKKTIKIYNLFNVSYDEIVQSGNIDKYISEVIPDVDTVYTYKNKLRGDVRNKERVYKVVREIQDLSDTLVVEGKNENMVKVIIVLLTELLIMVYLVEENNSLIGEKVMEIIASIVTNNKITKEEENILRELYEKYKNLSYLELEVKEKTKVK